MNGIEKTIEEYNPTLCKEMEIGSETEYYIRSQLLKKQKPTTPSPQKKSRRTRFFSYNYGLEGRQTEEAIQPLSREPRENGAFPSFPVGGKNTVRMERSDLPFQVDSLSESNFPINTREDISTRTDSEIMGQKHSVDARETKIKIGQSHSVSASSLGSQKQESSKKINIGISPEGRIVTTRKLLSSIYLKERK